MGNKTGRPPKAQTDKKTNVLQIRLTDNELKELETVADKMHTTKNRVLLWGLELVKEKIK